MPKVLVIPKEDFDYFIKARSEGMRTAREAGNEELMRWCADQGILLRELEVRGQWLDWDEVTSRL